MLALVYLLLLWQMHNHRFAFDAVIGLGVFFVALVVTYLMMGPEGEGNSITAARALVNPVLLFTAGRLLCPSDLQTRTLVRAIVAVSIITVLLGAIEQFLLSTGAIWKGWVGLESYLLEVKGVVSTALRPGTGVTHNFWFLSPAGQYRRLAGLSASPLSTGYYLVLPAVITLVLTVRRRGETFLPRYRWVVVVIIWIGLLLTITRGAILASLSALGVAMLLRGRRAREKNQFRPLMVIGALALLSILAVKPVRQMSLDALLLRDRSAPGHIAAIREGFDRLDSVLWTGRGLGSAGGSSQFGGVGANLVIGENSYFVVAHQLGVPGLLLFLTWLLSLLAALLSRWRRTQGWRRDLYASMAGVLIGYAISGFVSEQLLTFTSVAHFWLLSGALLSLRTMHTPYHGARQRRLWSSARTDQALAAGPAP